MYSRNLFGSFYPVYSKIHNMSVIVKLVNFFIFLLVMIGSISLELHLFVLAILILTLIESRVPFKFYFNMFYSLRFIYIFLIFLFYYLSFSLTLSLVFLLKLILIIEYLALLIFTTSLSELDYGIYKVLSPINFLNLNTSYISLFILNIIRFIPIFITTFNNTIKIQAKRGIDYYHSGIIGRFIVLFNSLSSAFSLTIKKIKSINTLAKMRHFSLKNRRTNLRSGKFGFYSFMLLTFHILFLVIYVLEANIL